MKMRRLYGVDDERPQMVKIRYMQRKDYTQRLICKTLHEHNSMVMRKLNEDGSMKRMFTNIKRLMRKDERKDKSIKVSNGSGRTVSDEQEVEKEVERLWGKLFCTNGNAALGDYWKFYDKCGGVISSAGDECCNNNNNNNNK